MWDSSDKDAYRAVRVIKLILLPTFSSQLSFVLGSFNDLLTKQHFPNLLVCWLLGRGCLTCSVCPGQERRFLRMLRDAGIQDVKKHPVKGNSLKPLVQQYEGALCKLEKTVKVIEMGRKITCASCSLVFVLQFTLSTGVSVQDPFLCLRQYQFSVRATPVGASLWNSQQGWEGEKEEGILIFLSKLGSVPAGV